MKPIQPDEAIAWARKQKVVLPTEYYGLLQGRARAAAFSISGLSTLDQIEAVRQSLNRALEEGESFGKWKDRVKAGEIPLDLPAHRIETIFRTNIQGWYAAGRCRSIEFNKDAQPYLMYSAVNDSRTRPAHAAMHGYIARVDDPIWRTWTPPAGFNCRCTVIGLTEAQAKRRGFKPDPGVTPDPGWDYSVCEDGPEEGAARAIEGRKGRCGRGMAADPAGHVAAELALREPAWCAHSALSSLMDRYKAVLVDWNDIERLARYALGKESWEKHIKKAQDVAPGMGLDVPEAVVARAYTDFDLDVWPLMNRLARE
ncbi:MAG TPA: hypothetical protein EYP90_03120, partial [Chromatiaceae bacterium]|nr:hypothetical protein [Chromatiaceae bacterium]